MGFWDLYSFCYDLIDIFFHQYFVPFLWMNIDGLMWFNWIMNLSSAQNSFELNQSRSSKIMCEFDPFIYFSHYKIL